MSSEPEENADPAGEPNPEPSEKDGDAPGAPKENNERAKPKKRRRGKKRKHRKESAATCESGNPGESEHENLDSPPWDSDEDLSCDVHSFADVIIRPIDVPKAPENSTQFIMDDHQECRLYMSFESESIVRDCFSEPPRILPGDVVEPGEDAAYRDIDYEYESPQDFDNSAYYDREFERSYKNNRFDELMRLPRAEIAGMLHSLESRSRELHDDLVKENPSPMLDKLQQELLELQEKHNVLQEHNAKLTALVVRRHREGGVSCTVEGSRAEPRSSVSSGSRSPVHDPCHLSSKFADEDIGLASSDPRSHESRVPGEGSRSPDFGSPDSESRVEPGPSAVESEYSDSGTHAPSGERYKSPCSEPRGDVTELLGEKSESESPDSESRGLGAGPLRKSELPDSSSLRPGVGPLRSGSTHSGPVPDCDSDSRGEDSPEREVRVETRHRNNVDGVALSVAFQEKCSSVVKRDEEQLSASETGVV